VLDEPPDFAFGFHAGGARPRLLLLNLRKLPLQVDFFLPVVDPAVELDHLRQRLLKGHHVHVFGGSFVDQLLQKDLVPRKSLHWKVFFIIIIRKKIKNRWSIVNYMIYNKIIILKFGISSFEVAMYLA